MRGGRGWSGVRDSSDGSIGAEKYYVWTMRALLGGFFSILVLSIGCLHVQIAFIVSIFTALLIERGSNNTVRSQWAMVCCVY